MDFACICVVASGVGRCLILGGPNFFFGDICMYTLCMHMPAFYVCKAQ